MKYITAVYLVFVTVLVFLAMSMPEISQEGSAAVFVFSIISSIMMMLISSRDY